MKNKFAILYVIILLITFNTCGVLSEKEDKVDQQANREIYQQVLQLATQYDADIQWLTFAEDSVFFTIELQRALFEPPDRSLLVIAPIVDIIKHDNEYLFTAVDWRYKVDYQLQCNEQQIEYVLNTSKNNSDIFKVYAIIINPESIYIPAVKLVDEMDIGDILESYNVSKIIVVKGTCLDVLSVGDDPVEIEELLTSLAGSTEFDQ